MVAKQNFTKFDHVTQAIQEILAKRNCLVRNIGLIWIPSHIRINVNEEADALDKVTCILSDSKEVHLVEPYGLQNRINSAINLIWNNTWKSSPVTELSHLVSFVFFPCFTRRSIYSII